MENGRFIPRDEDPTVAVTRGRVVEFRTVGGITRTRTTPELEIRNVRRGLTLTERNTMTASPEDLAEYDIEYETSSASDIAGDIP
ncbi:hypothetical protein BV898_15144 [Hypsibius exemplaris]|uniref:Uncharacterized protein n=1 Tax=Hypsibius exemplaris TaxID=2072580 RepID=A0A9X6NJR3_HYPEX|nr:hypothetical protein BV898_15144 [Hypsibius exemplaris]